MALCLWLTGRGGSGKSTIARAVAEELERAGLPVVLLDRDEVRHLVDGIDSMLWLVRTLTEGGVTAVVASDVPDRDEREQVRSAVTQFVEVFVDDGTGSADDGYEEPFAPELRVPTHDREQTASIAVVISWLEHTGVLTQR